MYRLLFGCFVLLTFPVLAARIVSVDVSPKNSGKVTTDEVFRVVTLIDETDKRPVELAVRAFLIGKDDSPEPIKGAKAEYRLGWDGENFGIRAEVKTAAAVAGTPFTFQTTEILVPMDALELPDADRLRVGFVVSLLKEQRLLSPVATSWQLVDREGNERRVLSQELAPNPTPKKAAVRIIDNEGRAKEVAQFVTAFPGSKPNSETLEENEAKAQKALRNAPNALAGALTQAGTLAPHGTPVFFATNRKVTSVPRLLHQYNFTAEMAPGGVAGISYGYCEVNMPTREEEQSYWSRNKAKLLRSYLYQEKDFLQELTKGSSDKDVLLFVHGYNNSFEDVILQAARVKRDLEFPGNILAFSWPSKGSFAQYSYDETQAENSVDALYHVIERTMATTTAKGGKLSIVAHSLGNRILALALRKLFVDNGDKLLAGGKPIDVLVFAAADVDINIFSSIVPTATKMAKMVSFYYSTKDQALKFSNDVHGIVRAGLHPLFSDDMDTINVDKTSGWFSMGHAYYSTSDSVVLDLLLQFKYHWQAPKRHPPLDEDPEIERKIFFKHWLLTPLKS